jgi:hypothetical protein
VENMDNKLYKVTRITNDYNEMNVHHRLNVKLKSCTCGVWQDTMIPCSDALAYYRFIEEHHLEHVLQKEIHKYHKYDFLHNIYSKTIVPVVIDTLVKDNKTLPPNFGNKKQAGRPKKARFRNRTKFANSEESPIICSLCHKRGHNKLTCIARQEKEKEKELLKQQQREHNDDIKIEKEIKDIDESAFY